MTQGSQKVNNFILRDRRLCSMHEIVKHNKLELLETQVSMTREHRGQNNKNKYEVGWIYLHDNWYGARCEETAGYVKRGAIS